jgi:NADPH:quinone reductase-like Zn-dependent oxidoreductase
MKSYHGNLGAGLEDLTLKEHPEPKIRPDQVLVRVRAASLSFRELSILIHGRYPLPVKPDVIVSSEGAGEVVAVGEAVTRARIGDRVITSIFPRWMDGPFTLEYASQLGGSLDGMLTERIAIGEDAIVPIPEHLSFEEAATLPCAGVTAWNALTGGRPLRAGESVLTLGSGGVSLFALQFAKLFGAHVVATTSTDEKAARLRSLGADHVVNYRSSSDWAAEVRAATGGRGADHVIEVGGPATLELSLRATAVGGEVAWVGSLARDAPTVDVTALFNAAASVRAIAAGSRAQLAAMTRAIAFHRARPVIDRVFPFEETHAALAYYASGKAFGKVVIRVAS